ncbi:PadR family transcriptional regulator [Sphaerisporangium krabiense]|uniref:DNA-binding PadR family transcriptional regulator n=1 Tax=Sphaerisporangium krabiense TaxID=763782 RepID=A0A7W9DQ77_9ACTN|nr:PadR family transcriptional regulator [Sphaerisporangium krabiense]MBB5627113.1 DNA-binding PadR family transcriptional regulator [Sphaerisporangium krabiense]GII65269.1 PadR family transcriptional regulator [Sphaerisporangium krabiense]
MAKKRKVGNLLALAVLSAVVQRPMHPYEMASVLRDRGKEQDMDIKWGSLYTVVRNMERHGLIAAVETRKEGGRPERTTYRITDAGRAEYVDWVRELLAEPEREHPRFVAGLSVCAVLGPDEVARLLRQRLDVLEPQIAAEREALSRHTREVPRVFLIEQEYDLAVREAEVSWIRAFLDELTTGSFPDIDRWRVWHAAGEPPPDLIEIAERAGKTP